MTLIRGRWGFVLKEEMRDGGGMREVTPGKWVSKKRGRSLGSASRAEKNAEGRKSVQVKEPSYFS